MRTDTYLKLFFEEKQIKREEFCIEDKNGMTHFLDSKVVIENIKAAPLAEKKKIADILRKLDFFNKPIEPFIAHLAQGLVANY